METAYTSDELTPLLGNDVTSYGYKHLFRVSATSNQQTPLHGSYTALNEQTPPDGNDTASNGQTPSTEQDARPPVISGWRTFEGETKEVSLEEVVEAMCLAWHRHRRLPEEKITLDHFNTKELYAMHVAWRNVTGGRHSFQEHIIAEALAAAITKEFCPFLRDEDPDIQLYMIATEYKCLLTANLLREWKRITEGVGFPVRYIETVFQNSDEQESSVSEFWLRQVELYDRVQDFILHPRFQSYLPSLLIIWHLSFIILGVKFTECSMSHYLTGLLISLGFLGCVTVLTRLVLLYLTSKFKSPYNKYWEWNCLRMFELSFFVLFIVETFHFFNTYPITVPGVDQCVKNFYNAALVINYVSIALVSACVLAYSVKICVNQFDFWHWLVRTF